MTRAAIEEFGRIDAGPVTFRELRLAFGFCGHRTRCVRLLCFLRTLCPLYSLRLFFRCGSRRPVTSRRQLSGAAHKHPAATEEAAKRSTDVPEPPASAAARKRNTLALLPSLHGRRECIVVWRAVSWTPASNGEVYDMYKLTAVAPHAAVERLVRVTNVNNANPRSFESPDAGLFVDNRIIRSLRLLRRAKLSRSGPGVVPVRVEVLSPGVGSYLGFLHGTGWRVSRSRQC